MPFPTAHHNSPCRKGIPMPFPPPEKTFNLLPRRRVRTFNLQDSTSIKNSKIEYAVGRADVNPSNPLACALAGHTG